MASKRKFKTFDNHLREEYNRLLKDLKDAQNRIELLEKYRNCLIDFNNNCICKQNFEQQMVLRSLEMNYKPNHNLVFNEMNDQNIVKTINNENNNAINDSFVNISTEDFFIREVNTQSIDGQNEDIDNQLIPNNAMNEGLDLNIDTKVGILESYRNNNFLITEQNLHSIVCKNENKNNSLNENKDLKNDFYDKYNEFRSKIISELKAKNYLTYFFPKNDFILGFGDKKERQYRCLWPECYHICDDIIAMKCHIINRHKVNGKVGAVIKPFHTILELRKYFMSKATNNKLFNESFIENIDVKCDKTIVVSEVKNFKKGFKGRIIGYKCNINGCSYRSLSKSSIQLHVFENHGITDGLIINNNCEPKVKIEYNLRRLKRSNNSLNELSEELDNDMNYDLNEDSINHKNVMKTKLSNDVLLEKINNNEVEEEVDRNNDSIKVFRGKNRSIISYGCNWNECQYISKRKDYVLAHNRAKHTFEKPFNCDECDFKTHSNKIFTSHKKLFHALKQVFKCHFTGCRFETIHKNSIRYHIKHHKDVKPKVALNKKSVKSKKH